MMTNIKQYEHSGNPPIPDELATCIAFLQAAKIRAKEHISNPFTDQSWLEEPEQELMDAASAAIDIAVQNLEALRNALKREKEEEKDG
jgi:hypothetical protein